MDALVLLRKFQRIARSVLGRTTSAANLRTSGSKTSTRRSRSSMVRWSRRCRRSGKLRGGKPKRATAWSSGGRAPLRSSGRRTLKSCAVAAYIGPASVISQDENDVRSLGCRYKHRWEEQQERQDFVDTHGDVFSRRLRSCSWKGVWRNPFSRWSNSRPDIFKWRRYISGYLCNVFEIAQPAGLYDNYLHGSRRLADRRWPCPR